MLKRSKKILLEGTLDEFKNYPRGAEGREYVLMNIEEKGPDGSYAFYEKDEKGYIIPVSYKGAEGYDATEFILFIDPEFERVVLSAFDISGNGELSTIEAALVTDIGDIFKNNTSLISTKDLMYFNKVDSIKYLAFYGCTNLSSLYIPKSVTTIADLAFKDCTSLTLVTIPKNVKNLGSHCFDGCDGLSLKVLGDIDIKSTILVSSEFGTVNLESIYFLGTKTFPLNNSYTTTDVNEAVIGDSVTTIVPYTFQKCSHLSSIHIPSSVKTIGDFAFCESGIENITIDEGLETIGLSAFCGCSNLVSLTIPKSVNTMDGGVFRDCSNLVSVNFEGNDITLINFNTFMGCKKLKSFTIPSTVTAIWDRAFEECESLTSIEIPDSVTSIGNLVFNGCTNITQINIPVNVSYIASNAFSRCSNLQQINVDEDNPNYCSVDGMVFFKDLSKIVCVPGAILSVNIPENVTTIEGNIFKGCANLTSISVSENNSNYCSIDSVLYSKDISELIAVPEGKEGPLVIPLGVVNINNSASLDCSNITSVQIPDSVVEIKDSAFFGCSALTSIVIPSSVTTIGYGCFKECTNLTSVQLSSNLTLIPYSLFESCTNLNSIIIPNGVSAIRGAAFASCTSLTSVEIPSSVTSIYGGAFSHCTNLASVKCYGETPASFSDTYYGHPFYNIPTSCVLYVPINSLEAYLTANYWKDFLNIVGFETE